LGFATLGTNLQEHSDVARYMPRWFL
jgi:hypothetical protein